MNHGFSLGSNEILRAVFPVTIVSGTSTGGIIVGFSGDAVGSVPTPSANGAFGLYFYNNKIQQILNGTTSNSPENPSYSAGTYIVTVKVDNIYVSISAAKSDGSNETAIRILRSSVVVNNIYVFNSDNRGTSGSYIGAGYARKGLQHITPKSYGEGQTKNIHWSGDGTQSWRVYVPKTYDFRVPNPVVVCFHGHGTDETQWEY
jgi:hypothetical protein